MSQLKGYPHKKRDLDLAISDLYVTAEPVKTGQHALSVQAYIFSQEIGTDTVEASSTTKILNLTAHTIQVGDTIRIQLTGEEAKVLSTETNTVTLVQALSADPSGLDIDILRHRTPLVSSDGAIEVSSAPIRFVLDSVDTTVTEDTVTPANNTPLPVKLTGVTGDINITANDLNVQLSHIGASADSTRIGDGTETVEVTASGEMQVRDDDANTALTAIGVDTSSIDAKVATETTLASILSDTSSIDTKVATETTLAAILADTTSLDGKDYSTETTLAAQAADIALLEAKDFSTETTLAAQAADIALIEGKDFATQTTLAALLTELQAKADLAETQPVSAASLPLPTGAATEATLSSIDGKDFATQTTSAAILTELQLKADLTETQPVSAASLPLPTNASTDDTEYAEDSASTPSDKGTAILAVRDDAGGTRVGTDGDYTMLSVNASGELRVTGGGGGGDATAANQTTMIGHLSTIEGDTTSIDGKITACDTGNVTIASSALPTGAATETTLAALAAEDFATQTTLAALLTELQGKADLAETQPVSAASLPLPTGAATEATVATLATQTTAAAILTELQLKADLSETQPVSAASLPLPTGAATEATLLTIDADTGNIATDTSTIAGDTTSLDTKIPSQGQAVKASSMPVTIASDQDALDVNISGGDVQEFVRNDYSSGNVTTAAYTQLIASTSSAVTELEIFDSSGQTLVLATGAAASEVDKLYIVPGGNGRIPVSIAASTRISIKAVSATADTGEIVINLIG